MRDQRLFRSPRSRFIQARLFGKRVSTGHTDEKAASLWCDEYERKHASPRYAAAAAATLGPCIDDYLAEMRQRKSAAGTLSKEETRTGHFLNAWGDGLLMARIDARLVAEYIKDREKDAKQVTVHDELGTLRGILLVAKHHGLWSGEIVEVMPIRYARKAGKKTRAPSPEEVRSLMAQFHRYRAAHIAYLVATGCRISESFRARRKDFDAARGVLHVHGTKTSYADDDIPVTRISAPWLEYALANAPGKDRLFSPWGKYWRDLKAACVRAEIPQVTPNDLRRAFGTWHRLAGAHVPDVARMLRHGDDKLAQTTYARIGGEQLGAVVGRQLETAEGTSILHRDNRQNDPNDPNGTSDSAVITAPPARVELATLALGKHRTNARSVAGKQAWERKLQRLSTSNLHGPVCEKCGAIPILTRTFRIVGRDVIRVAA